MKKALSAIFALTLVLPLFASAQSNAELQAQAQTLLQQVAQLQAQIAAQGGGSVTNTVAVPTGVVNSAATNPNSCPQIGRILKRGSSGDDVARLQRFLALDPSVYPEGSVSGYFGALTEKAVQRWQSKYNIIQTGSPSTTGWGQLGPRTAAAIALLCVTGASAPVGGYIQVAPISGSAPLNVSVIATVNSTNSCSGAIYQLNWGDGSAPISIPVSANVCTQVSQTYQHTYTSGGTYQIILSAGAHQTGATITVTGGTSVPTTPTQGSTNGETFSASPVSGAAPLTVTFSGVVSGSDLGWCSTGCSDILTFGDGQQGAVPLPLSQSASQNYSITHTYTNEGTYSAILYQGQAGTGRPTVGSPITISVGSVSGNSSSNFSAPSLTRSVGGNPSAVSLQFDNGSGCPAYTLTWGDGSNDSHSGGGSCTTVTKNHTYTGSGSFTITLKRGSQTHTIGITIL